MYVQITHCFSMNIHNQVLFKLSLFASLSRFIFSFSWFLTWFFFFFWKLTLQINKKNQNKISDMSNVLKWQRVGGGRFVMDLYIYKKKHLVTMESRRSNEWERREPKTRWIGFIGRLNRIGGPTLCCPPSPPLPLSSTPDCILRRTMPPTRTLWALCMRR